jgi:hypothetical protein
MKRCVAWRVVALMRRRRASAAMNPLEHAGKSVA